MKLVLAERRRLAPTENIPRSVLDAIAAILTDTGKYSFKNGASLMCRVVWLSTVRSNPSHAEFPKITGSLRDWIDEYRRLREPTGEESSEEPTESDNQKASNAEFGQIDQMYDETMMRILLQLRFFKPKLGEDEAWEVVATSLQDMFGSELPDEYTTKGGVKERVFWLETVAKTRSHRFHSDVPNGLRDLMTEYVHLRNEARARTEAESFDSDNDGSVYECEDVCA